MAFSHKRAGYVVFIITSFLAGVESGDQCLLNSKVLSCFSGVIGLTLPWPWIMLVIGLSIATFGVLGLLSSIIYVLVFVAGFLAVVGHHHISQSKREITSDDPPLMSHEQPFCGNSKIFSAIEESQQSFKFDKRLTGSSCIDEVLQEVLEYFFRDYIHYWYYTISEHEGFLYELRLCIQKGMITFSNRSKEVQWVPFLTTRLVDDFAAHLKIFRITKERLSRKSEENSSISPDEAKAHSETDLEETFFAVEKEVEKGISREAICLDDEKEIEYLQDVSEVLLYLLLPPEDFSNKTVRYFLREIIACSVLIPTITLVCDPDYVNQTISWLCTGESAYTIESFLTTIKLCDDMDDLEETKRKVDLEIAKLRTQDSDGLVSGDIKRQLSSLMYVRKLCVGQIRRLKCGENTDIPLSMEQEPEPYILNLIGSKYIPKLTLKEILEDNTALSYFIEFMGGFNAEHYVFFYLTVEGFRVTAEQQMSLLAEQTLKDQEKGQLRPLEKVEKDFEQLKQAAANIYEEYLSPKASPRIILEDTLVRKIVKGIKSSEPSGAYFDAAQMHVYKVLESQKYFGAFLGSTSYIKCLMDMDLLKDRSDGSITTIADLIPANVHHTIHCYHVMLFHQNILSDDGTIDDDTLSTVSSDSSFAISREVVTRQEIENTGDVLWTSECDVRYSSSITQAVVQGTFGLWDVKGKFACYSGICKEGNKSYGIYSIHVCRTTSEGSNNWVVCRRYSDFHDLQMQLREKYPSLSWLTLPGKKTFGNMDRHFIEKRKHGLEEYLQNILASQVLDENPGMFELVAGFLEMGEYYKGKSLISRKMDHIVHPLKKSAQNLSHSIKTQAGDFTDGLKHVSKQAKPDREEEFMAGKLSDALESEDEDNIPLRIMLLLMDQIFDLKERNQWLRRRIVVLLKQIIKATFGDRINRKIVEYVDLSTSAEQIAEYVKQFRDSYWPGGILADPMPDRPEDVRRRMRMVTKAKMLGSIPDELKRFLGTEVTREGMGRMFDLFQHVNLNKRLFYVLFEAFLETLFPDNKFPEIFKKIHSRPRARTL